MEKRKIIFAANFICVLIISLSLIFFFVHLAGSFLIYRLFPKEVKIVKTKKDEIKRETFNANDVLYLFENNFNINSDQKSVGTIPQQPAVSIELSGTVVSDKKSGAFVKVNGKSRFVNAGESMDGLKIMAVKDFYIVVSELGISRKIMLGEKPKAAPLPPLNSMAPPVPGNYQLSKRFVEEQTNDIGKMLKDSKIVPVIKEGQTTGFRFEFIKEGSLLYQYGLRPGDIIRSINGMPLKSAEDSIRMYSMLRNESNILLEVESGGVTKTLSYEVK